MQIRTHNALVRTCTESYECHSRYSCVYYTCRNDWNIFLTPLHPSHHITLNQHNILWGLPVKYIFYTYMDTYYGLRINKLLLLFFFCFNAAMRRVTDFIHYLLAPAGLFTFRHRSLLCLNRHCKCIPAAAY